MKRRFLVPFALVVSLILLAGCGTKTTPPGSTASPIPDKHKQLVQMYYVGDTAVGFRLFSEMYELASPESRALQTLVSDLVSGKAVPTDPDYANLWGKGTSLRSIEVNGSQITVDLHLGKLNVGAEAESRAIDQILWTVNKFDPSIKSMVILVDGKKIESLAGHVDATKPFTLAADYQVLSTLQISSIRDGQIIIGAISVAGEACTFEANVPWKLIQGGKVLRSGAVTAGQSCPVRSKWTLDLGTLTPGAYVLEVDDISAKDGSVTAKDTKSFVVQ